MNTFSMLQLDGCKSMDLETNMQKKIALPYDFLVLLLWSQGNHGSNYLLLLSCDRKR